MMFRRFFAAALVGGLLTASPVAAANLLGVKVVNYGSEKDVIVVPGPKRYKSIQLCVKVHAVKFRDLDVVFVNGGKEDVALRKVIYKGQCTRWVNLRGPKRNIKKIVLRYDTFGNVGPRARVTAYGR